MSVCELTTEKPTKIIHILNKNETKLNFLEGQSIKYITITIDELQTDLVTDCINYNILIFGSIISEDISNKLNKFIK